MRNGHLSLLSVLYVAIFLCSGCGMPDPEVEGGVYGVTFVLDGGGTEKTRSTAVRDEAYLREWCLYIVDVDGAVFETVPVSGSPYAIGNYPAGMYKAYAVVNCGVPEGDFATEEEIKSVRRFLEDESSAFSMFGSCEFSVPEDIVCSIPISRLVSKVEIDEVRTDFSQSPYLNAGPFTIDSMYLINVAGESALSDADTFLPVTWYNKRGYNPNEADALLCDAVSKAVAPDVPYATSHYFYCYQNRSASDSHTDTWSPRHTRLVIECTVAGRKTYYPIDIVSEDGTLERNCRYLIKELVITDLGVDRPDEPLSGPLPCRFSTVIVPWDTTFLISEEF